GFLGQCQFGHVLREIPNQSLWLAAALKAKGPAVACRTLRFSAASYFDEVTSEWVIACTESAMRFCTPTLRMSLATWAFTVRSSMPSTEPISLLERPTTRSSSTSFSRSVNVTRPAGKMRPGEEVTRSIKIESTRRGAHTEP